MQMQSTMIKQAGKSLNPAKIIQNLRKIQFVFQFFILNKYDQDHHSVPQLLMIIEAIKFYFKTLAVAESKGIYIQSAEVMQEPQQEIQELMQQKSTIDEQIDRQRKLLQTIKIKPYQSYNFHPNMFEKMANGKKMQLVTAVRLPRQLKKTQLKFRHVIGELLTVLRPLISIICIRLYGINSYKSYFISLIIDLIIILFFQKGLKVTSNQEKEQMSRRKTQLITRYLFRKPFFLLLKRILIQPLLAKIIKPQRILSRFILSIVEMQSSISLTL